MRTNLSPLEWFEELPDDCPPDNSIACFGTYYRIALSNPANSSDFFSQRKLQPHHIFEDINECILKSLSVFDTLQAAQLRLKLPKFRKARIAKINLQPTDGQILKTFGPQHYSWWRSTNFDVNIAIIL